MRWLSSLAKLFLGVLLAVILLSLASLATARYFMAKLTAIPPRPSFDNDIPATPPNPTPIIASAPNPQLPAEPKTTIANTTTPANPSLEPGAYEALVIQPIGLVLREGPGLDYPQIGGVEYEEAVVVLSESSDKAWLRVRLPGNGLEGWVKAGNTEKVEG
ncbi:MAG: SH3 domain-containing protein [Cyanothece sp. SIO1E1]|nr:SH3 domain-containing protein [Cyanothece sp. SIO1E1]